MQLAMTLWRLLPFTAADEALSRESGSVRESLPRDRETELLLALPPEGHAELFHLRETWVARLRASQDIRDRIARIAERRAALEQFEQGKQELFRRYSF